VWNELLGASSANSLFLTWEWVSTWWRVYGGDAALHVLTAHDPSGLLVGIAPLKIVRRRMLGIWGLDMLEFIGWGKDVTPEYLDLIVRTGWEEPVVSAFVAHLASQPSVPAIDLRPIRSGSTAAERFMHGLAGSGSAVGRSRDGVCPIATLPASADDFLCGRSRNYRKKMREYERRCERDLGARFRVSATAAELECDMEALVTLHRRRWGHLSRAFQTLEYRRFHQELAQATLHSGWVRLFSLNADGRPIALLYCFLYADRYYYYQAGWEPELAKYHLGLVLMHKAVQHAIQEGAAVFDFLRGEESYKARWATDRVRSERLTLWPGPATRLAGNAHDIVTRVIYHKPSHSPAPIRYARPSEEP
jgi:CelD/BcsL family acetyltransferase involved in cellulose biosynthesis